MDDRKASQKAYATYNFDKIEKRPPTRLARNMMMFKEIFIEPELKRIDNLKEKEKEFTNLVHNVINQQYDKLLEVQFKKIHPEASKGTRPATAAPITSEMSQRPTTAMSQAFAQHG